MPDAHNKIVASTNMFSPPIKKDNDQLDKIEQKQKDTYVRYAIQIILGGTPVFYLEHR
jgi:hypothetical protein